MKYNSQEYKGVFEASKILAEALKNLPTPTFSAEILELMASCISTHLDFSFSKQALQILADMTPNLVESSNSIYEAAAALYNNLQLTSDFHQIASRALELIHTNPELFEPDNEPKNESVSIELSKELVEFIYQVDNSIELPEADENNAVRIKKSNTDTFNKVISVISFIISLITFFYMFYQDYSNTALTNQHHTEQMLQSEEHHLEQMQQEQEHHDERMQEERKQTSELQKQSEYLKQIAENTAPSVETNPTSTEPPTPVEQ